MSNTTPSRKRLYSILAPSGLLLLLAAAFWYYNSEHPAPSALPQLVLPSLGGDHVALDHLQGKPLVLNLWATWCPPCRAELPLLIKARQSHPGIRFYFAEQGNAYNNVDAFAKKYALPLPLVLLDTNTKLSQFYGVLGYPTTVFYNSHGNIVKIYRGELKPAVLQQYLEQITQR
ncbi:TlpA family protein disulfide reductase [Acidihalobacter prosperus]|uniref:Thioredoxin domain-containing protein n=1 Tax=Acidihalobacter prosperus TaxID=160660 RepID=A0A1A6C3T6_9GAMM|nr:TlpA disulfide reductase family protein [Acidihalobacter prosperus]OBS09227.1 hypothetical protein Thpro_021555 [Acidihalobacter prosperus]